MCNHDYPSDGYTYYDIMDFVDNADDYDAEDPSTYPARCEYCGTAIRYVHLLRHPMLEPYFLHVGCRCADRLTGTDTASKYDELARKVVGRLRRFIDSVRWKRRKNGNFITYEGYPVRIWENRDDKGVYFSAQIGYVDGRSFSNPIYRYRYVTSKFRYVSLRDAKKQVFMAIATGKWEEWLRKHGKIGY